MTYRQLLDVFLSSHNPCASAWSRQYMSGVWYDSEAQKRDLEAAFARYQQGGKRVKTHVAALDRFWLAEDYHQKYALRRHKEFEAAYLEIYPQHADFVDSTAVTRVNAWLGGHGDKAAIERVGDQLGLDPKLVRALKDRLR